jgi:S-sulfosulfanyl-L-cysteine sulfohydrolase
MSISRREFIQLMGIAAASGMALNSKGALASHSVEKLYEVPKYGNVHLLHFTDCHAQLNPIYFREPTVNLGVGQALGKLPHLVGEKLLNHVGIRPNTPEAYAFSTLNFEEAALSYGKVGGFSHLATLVKRMKESRPGALLLDGGDTWQGSATALWTNGQDMVDACLELGVDVMTPHWEMTLGDKRVKEIIERDFKGKISFVAQNIKTSDFGDQVFDPYIINEMNGVLVAIIGQAFPYTPIAHPRHFVPDWTFGIQEESMQKMVDEVRSKGAKVVVVLSHNGMDVDIKMASRVRGIDAIMGGHTHDGMPIPIIVDNSGGKTLVTNAGSNSKFLGVLDFDVSNGKIRGYKYRLLPVFSNFLPADAAMDKLISKIRRPFETKLNEKLAITQDTLYRRGNFNGTFDQIIVEALMEVKGAEIAFSPGFRWGTSLLPNSDILMEHLMDQTATTYSYSTLSEMSGGRIKTVMEDIADNLFNPDPYYQQGGDMVRVGGMSYAIEPKAKMGSRIQDMRLNGKPIEENKIYKVAGWAPVAEGASGEPVWDVVASWLRSHKTVPSFKLNTPRIIGMEGNPGKVG